ncbi:MAG TPA: SRPBCC family protein [Gemmatimonadales bacterium]|nr:SRPBCC family protein [Gemmatimonadales bacterium]
MSSRSAKVTLPTPTQILITREFAAPKHLVYKAWTTPELVSRWWCGQRGRMTVTEIDLRVGGKWRYVMIVRDKFEVGFHGEYREIVPNQRIVSTEVYEQAGAHDPDANPVVNTIKFAEHAGVTTLTLLTDCPSQEVRDIIINSGMEGGMQEAMDLLEQVAISLR